jgi:hypothetical protein
MEPEDFDDIPPLDEEAEDFSKFNPDAYLRKRGRGTDSAFPGSRRAESDAGGFDNFDPDAYLRKRRAERGQAGPLSDPYAPDAAPRGRRRRHSITDDDEPIGDTGAAAGIGAGLIGLLGLGEGAGLNVDILRRASPLIKTALLAVGCAIVLALAGICVLGFMLATALTRR